MGIDPIQIIDCLAGRLPQIHRCTVELDDFWTIGVHIAGLHDTFVDDACTFEHDLHCVAGAATNPDPEIFAYAAAQVKNVLELTHELGGANYVLWGGREGYEALLNTDIKRELAQLGRFLTMVVEHNNKIGFNGTILIEPKPQEPTKHQYDYDVGTIFGMLKAFDLEDEVKIDIEQNHAIMVGHSFEHEIALASALGIFGSIDSDARDCRGEYDQ